MVWGEAGRGEHARLCRSSHPLAIGADIPFCSSQGIELDCRFEGDLFKMEDQRNWSDGSFKTYSTPLSAPRPKAAARGRPIRQSVHISLSRSRARAVSIAGEEGGSISIGPPDGHEGAWRGTLPLGCRAGPGSRSPAPTWI